MSYAGMVLDMIKRQKMNRDLQKRRRSQRQEPLKGSATTSHLTFNPDFGKDLAPEDIQQRTLEIHEESRMVLRQNLIRSLIFFVVLAIIFIFTLS